MSERGHRDLNGTRRLLVSLGWRPTPQLWNRVARIVVSAGGISIVIAVLAIVVFIAREAAPLFGRAKTQPVGAAQVPDAAEPLAVWADDDRGLQVQLVDWASNLRSLLTRTL